MPKVQEALDPTCKRETGQDQGRKCEKQRHILCRSYGKTTVPKKYNEPGNKVCDYGQMADLFLLARLRD